MKIEKLLHLEHIEDLHLKFGRDGFNAAVAILDATHKYINWHIPYGYSISTKMDGSPSIVFGINPENGKFFVGSKSVFNKNQKINYTREDVINNHGHSAGLCAKLVSALEHLPKIVKDGIFQGDVMFTDGEVTRFGDRLFFTPNTITYAVDKKSHKFEAIEKAKFGICIHTAYVGDSLTNMKAIFNCFYKNLHPTHKHQDVFETSTPTRSPGLYYLCDLAGCIELDSRLTDYEYSFILQHSDIISLYINKCIRENEILCVEKYIDFFIRRHTKEIDLLKTEKAKNRKLNDMNEMLKISKESLQIAFNIHIEMQRLKDNIMAHLWCDDYLHFHADNIVEPEGYVVELNDIVVKLVNRKEFSRNNFNNHR